MIQLIRIEHHDGMGMFVSDDNTRRHSLYLLKDNDSIAERLLNRHNSFNDPFQDNLNLNKDGRTWFCAYKSISQLQEWTTPEEVIYLFSQGYKVYLLEVTEYQVGEHQIMYTKESITLKKDISILFR